MENNTMTTKKALLVVGTMVLLVGFTLVVPAEYVGIKKPAEGGLILRSPEELASLRGDNDRNGNPDWRDMLVANTSTTTMALAAKTTITEEERRRLNDPNNITASFSKNLYTASAYANQKGELSQAEQEALVDGIIKAEQDKIVSKEYQIQDLTLIKDESAETKKAYGNALGTVYTKALKQDVGSSDLEIIQAYTVDKDASVLDSLVVKKNNLNTIITSMLAMRVPYSAAPYHLLVVNRLSQYKTILENIAQAEEDPMRATMAFNMYLATLRSVYSSFDAIQNYFVLEGITFTKNEAGFVLTPGYTK